jgi:hypothetical protein
VALPALAAVFAVGLIAPIPSLGNHARAQVASVVAERLPGWEMVRIRPSWEGAWTVVAACGGRRIGFQMVPGHGLGPRDAWLQPQNDYSRVRLARSSDDPFYLVWYERVYRPQSLSCRMELAMRSTRAPARHQVD